ncbi:MAG TPA: alpha-L-fucosidase C-terminal domain-containing protein, partial [Bacteroidales bacterium]|nr:alpha-L-fucosidase C-terminal domain-containing protein [Bacteroidales bacterium]
ADIRFTSKGNTLYAFVMEKPTEDIKITSLGKKTWTEPVRVRSVKMPGSDEKLRWKQEENALVITLPARLPEWKVVCFRIELK